MRQLFDRFGKTVLEFEEASEMGVTDNDLYDQFMKSIRFKNKHYVLKLTWKRENNTLPDNYQPSFQRLISLHRKLSKDTNLLRQFDEIIQIQEKERIIKTVPINATARSPGTVHYIPHRAVIRDDRKTTKIRVVYDASANKNGPSLNECLETGPCLLPKIFEILVRFRAYKYCLTSDIKAAFLNIRIAEEDRHFLRFLLVSNIEENETEFIVKRFTSVVFGLNCSPFLLEATIKYHVEKYFNRDFNSQIVEHFLRDL